MEVKAMGAFFRPKTAAIRSLSLKTRPRTNNSNSQAKNAWKTATLTIPANAQSTSFNLRTVGLPQHLKWQQLKLVCSKEKLTTADAIMKNITSTMLA